MAKIMETAIMSADQERLRKRFWEHVDILDDLDACWEWKMGTHITSGHGRLSIYHGGKSVAVSAHRVAYWLTYGWLPSDVAHTCMNHICVNPNHLRADEGKTNNNKDPDKTKIPQEDVPFLVELYENNEITAREIADIYGVHISKAKLGYLTRRLTL